VAEKIVLSLNAENDRLSILEYFVNNNEKSYASKIFEELNDAFEIISEFPYSGKVLNNIEHRSFTKKPFEIIYMITNDEIVILHIWDTRRNPEDLIL
jgi:plasmid stabilization system protein ParE